MLSRPMGGQAVDSMAARTVVKVGQEKWWGRGGNGVVLAVGQWLYGSYPIAIVRAAVVDCWQWSRGGVGAVAGQGRYWGSSGARGVRQWQWWCRVCGGTGVVLRQWWGHGGIGAVLGWQQYWGSFYSPPPIYHLELRRELALCSLQSSSLDWTASTGRLKMWITENRKCSSAKLGGHSRSVSSHEQNIVTLCYVFSWGEKLFLPCLSTIDRNYVPLVKKVRECHYHLLL